MRKTAIVIGAYPDIGKGIFAASLAYLGQQAGLRCGIAKFDGYLNPHSGIMNPYHSDNSHFYTNEETFVLDDGYETDVDHGFYERFLNLSLPSNSCITNGYLFMKLFDMMKKGEFPPGEIVKFSHLRRIMQASIEELAGDNEFFVLEIGGTIGDEETVQLYKTLAEMRRKNDSDVKVFMLAPYLTESGDSLQYDLSSRTKLARKSFIEAANAGLAPDYVVIRSHAIPRDSDLEYVRSDCNLEQDKVIVDMQNSSVYAVPACLAKQGLSKSLFSAELPDGPLEEYVRRLHSSKGNVSIGIIGKALDDSNISLVEAISHAAASIGVKAHAGWIEDPSRIKECHGIVIGEGLFDLDAKIEAYIHCRNKNKPCLGISFGMDVMMAAENMMDSSQILNLEQMARGKLITGLQQANIAPGSRLSRIYGDAKSHERFRHWDRLLCSIPKKFSEAATSRGISCAVESKDEEFIIGVRYHPEFLSRPMKPHPLFLGLVNAAREMT